MIDVANFSFLTVLFGMSLGSMIFLLSRFTKRNWKINGTTVIARNDGSKQKSAEPTLSADDARLILSRLHSVTSEIGRDVEEHDVCMDEIAGDLREFSGDVPSMELVLRAVDRIAEANARIREKLAVANKEIQEQAAFIASQMTDALIDPLTRICNRRAFDRELNRRLAEWKRSQLPFSLIMLDVDLFKRFNDTHGHRAGDEVLKGVGQVLSDSVRESDLATRFGGEEFAIVLPNTRLHDAKEVAERIGQAIRSTQLPFEGKCLRVTVSIGLSSVLAADNAEDVLERADRALYASKNAGRDCAHYHDGKKSEIFGQHSQETLPQMPKMEKPAALQCESAAERQPASAPADRYADLETGLPTRIVFDYELSRRLAEWQRNQLPLAIGLIAIDDFEAIKKRGEAAWGLALDSLAKFLQAAFRETDLVARCGENQFAVILPGSNSRDACIPCERIRKAIARCDRIRFQGNPFNISISAGVAGPGAADNTTLYLKRATEALRVAQQSGGNRTYAADNDIPQPVGAESHSV